MNGGKADSDSEGGKKSPNEKKEKKGKQSSPFHSFSSIIDYRSSISLNMQK